MAKKNGSTYSFIGVLILFSICISFLEKYPEIAVIAIVIAVVYSILLYCKNENHKEEQGISKICEAIEKEVSLFNSAKTGIEQAVHFRNELRLIEKMFSLYPSSKQKFMSIYQGKKEIENDIYEELLKKDIRACLNKIDTLKTQNAKINTLDKTIDLLKNYSNIDFIPSNKIEEYILLLKQMGTELKTDQYIEKAEKYREKGQYAKAEQACLEALEIIKNDDVPDELQKESIDLFEQLSKELAQKKAERTITS